MAIKKKAMETKHTAMTDIGPEGSKAGSGRHHGNDGVTMARAGVAKQQNAGDRHVTWEEEAFSTLAAVDPVSSQVIFCYKSRLLPGLQFPSLVQAPSTRFYT